MDKIKEIIEKVKNGWNELNKKKKIAMIVIIVGILLFVSVYTILSKKVDYVTLYRDLDLEDAGKIVQDLDSKQMKYKLENGGTSILIDSKDMDRYRLELAIDGNLPSDSVGFELFDDMGMMVTDDDRKIMYQRALEGELERSISSLDAIKKAKVHLVMSQKSIFETEEREASASVILDIKPNAKLEEDSLRGIGSMVSGAVDNLPLNNIKIIDSKGNLLSMALEDSDTGNALNMLNKHHKIKADYEKELEANVMRLLGPVLGTDKVKVVINTELDFDSTESETTKYSNPVPRSEQLNVNGKDIETNEAGNIGNTSSNVINEVGGDNATYNRTINNELTTEKSNTISAPGKIEKITASIVYDGTLSRKKVAEIEDLVGTAIGYDFDREDLINVVGIEFDQAEKDKLEEQLEDFNSEDGVLAFVKENKFIFIGLLGLLTILLLIFGVRKIFRKEEEEEFDFEGYDSREDILSNVDKVRDETEKSTEVELISAEDEIAAKEYAEEHPDLAAELIKVWMKDDK